MAAAYYVVKNGLTVAITTTGTTNPEIMKILPQGNPAGDRGVINKTPGAGSVVLGNR